MIEYDEDEQMSAMTRASHELKRVDHLIFVSLKYTRTVDVIRNIIHRLINCYEFVFDHLLHELEEKGAIYEVPSAPGQKIKMIKEYYGTTEGLQEFLAFYIMLRQLDKGEYKALREFRRHVTMEAILPSKEVIEVNIDVITDYYKRTKDFLQFAKEQFFVKKM